MMNVMAAAGKEGSAELPAIKVALEQCGMAAKGAGVSFEETNAAIQVLDKAGKKGAEGGVALRNVMMILSRGRFLPKETLEELQAAGVDVGLLTDKTRTLAERLEPLKAVLKDSALFSQLFGMENSNAAMALVQGIDEIRRYEGAITGTNTAVEQAGIIMESYNERLSRVRARFDDLKISLFNASGDAGHLGRGRRQLARAAGADDASAHRHRQGHRLHPDAEFRLDVAQYGRSHERCDPLAADVQRLPEHR